MTTILLTCAGQSTRFPNHRAKWSLTHPTGHMMAAVALSSMKPCSARMVAVFNPEDLKRYGKEAIEKEFLEAGLMVDIVSTDGQTKSQVETVLQAVKNARIRGGIVVRDCDNYFEASMKPNSVASVDLNDVDEPIIARNKSYARYVGNHVTELVEKRVVSNLFCCGAYSFRDVRELVASAEGCEYLSQVVTKAVRAGVDFELVSAKAYSDWGTEADWLEYIKKWRTLFVDIDGVLVEASHRSFAPCWGESPVIQENIEALNRLADTGRVEIILTTSRPETMRVETKTQLRDLKFDRLVMGLRNCSRVLVNDSVSKRGHLTALAVNLERESPLLGEHLSRLP